LTLIVLQRRIEHNDIRVLADSRLLSKQGILTDHMPKLFRIPIRGYVSGRDKPAFNTAVGFAFSGSANVAFATVATLQGYLDSLSLEMGRDAPNLYDVSQFCRSILLRNWRDFGVHWGENASCEMFLFGALPSDKSLGAHYLKTVIHNGEATVGGDILDFREPKLFCIGSGSQWYLREIQRRHPILQPWNTLQDAIHSDELPDVGGAVQVALASKGGVVLPQVVLETPERGHGSLGRFYLGRMDLENVGHASVGHFVVR